MRNLLIRMRTRSGFAAIVGIAAWMLAGNGFAQTRVEEPMDTTQVLERGPNHSRIQRITVEQLADGKSATRTNSWTLLEDGLNYWDAETSGYEPSREEIEITGTGAVARYGQHQVRFSSNANDSKGAVDILIRNSVRIRASVLALRYFDPVDGRSAVIGMAQDAQGELLPPNQVLYSDVFDGCKADVLYTYRKGGIESDIILREVPPSPAAFGLHPETARIEVVTEFFEAPAPAKRQRILDTVDDPALRAAVAEPDWIDEELDFGANQIGRGRAFAWSAREAAKLSPDQFPSVAKKWQTLPDGRTVLIESVDFIGLLDDLLALPGPVERLDALRAQKRAWAGQSPVALRHGVLRNWAQRSPSAPLRRGIAEAPPRALASGVRSAPARFASADRATKAQAGVVIDWSSINVGSTNMTFRGDETYFVTGNCLFYGMLVVEGGTVVKFSTNGFTSITLVGGSIECRTSLYRPAVFTIANDNSVGDIVVAGTPAERSYFGGMALCFYNIGGPILLEHLRIKHAAYGVYFDYNCTNNTLRHSQIIRSVLPISVGGSPNGSVRMENVLIESRQTYSYALSGTNTTFAGQHLTLVGADNLLRGGTLSLTNSLVVGITNVQAYSGSSNFQTTGSSGVFRSEGDGGFYLPVGSILRNSGSSNIAVTLAKELRVMTTEAPTNLSGSIGASRTLTRQVALDIDVPDLGYHYAPIDYRASGVVVTNATLTMEPGVTIAGYGTNGIILKPQARLAAAGGPGNLVRFVRQHCVQEGSNTNSIEAGSVYDFLVADSAGASGASAPSVDIRFGEVAHLAVNPYGTGASLIRSLSNSPVSSLILQHSMIRGPCTMFWEPSSGERIVAVTNTLFELAPLMLYDQTSAGKLSVRLKNNLIVSGTAQTWANFDTNAWFIQDNLVVGVGGISLIGTGPATVSHNGFQFGLTAFGTSTRTNLTPSFVVGPLGRYYYPTNAGSTNLSALFDAGSTTASSSGLYHFTTKAAAGSKEGLESNSTVDIGFHYVGVGDGGGPLDLDSDGKPDAAEDWTGNGAFDVGETDWTTSSFGVFGPASVLIYTPLR